MTAVAAWMNAVEATLDECARADEAAVERLRLLDAAVRKDCGIRMNR